MKKANHKSALEAIRKYVELCGGKCYVLSQSQRLYGSAGIPDLRIHSGCRCMNPVGSKCAWWEVKVGADKLSPAQCEFLKAEGQPDNWGDFDAFLKKMNR